MISQNYTNMQICLINDVEKNREVRVRRSSNFYSIYTIIKKIGYGKSREENEVIISSKEYDELIKDTISGTLINYRFTIPNTKGYKLNNVKEIVIDEFPKSIITMEIEFKKSFIPIFLIYISIIWILMISEEKLIFPGAFLDPNYKEMIKTIRDKNSL